MERMSTGVANLDELLGGGIPTGATVLLAGPPGAGKSILAQQLLFHSARCGGTAVYFVALGEPPAKAMRHCETLTFFDVASVNKSVHYKDITAILREGDLTKLMLAIKTIIADVDATAIAIDSIKALYDLGVSRGTVRQFVYDLSFNVSLGACTAFLVRETAPDACLPDAPEFNIADGVIVLGWRTVESGEPDRTLRILKLRGSDHAQGTYRMRLTARGVEVEARA